ncbi:MAG: hypothetical protein K0U36_00005, partial [Alphaproteobacteria bacterium]|nr:hypothetical protein [Alphaproteobacteria bacterium]
PRRGGGIIRRGCVPPPGLRAPAGVAELSAGVVCPRRGCVPPPGWRNYPSGWRNYPSGLANKGNSGTRPDSK